MTSRLLLDLTYGVLADIEAEDWLVKRRFAQGFTRDDWRYLNRILILSLFPRAGDNCARVSS